MRRITIVGEYNNEEENEEDYDEKDEVQKGAGEFSISTQSSRVDTPSEPDSLE